MSDARPSFQFYPGDWRTNSNLRRCSPAARGVWMDILCVLHDSDEYGLVRWPLVDLVNAASAPMELVAELVAKSVLKGGDADAEPYVHHPRHAGKRGDPVVLVDPMGGPVWYSSRLVRDEWRRLSRGADSRFSSDRQPGRSGGTGGGSGGSNHAGKPAKTSPTRRVGERQGDGPSSSSSASLSSVAKATGASPAPSRQPDRKSGPTRPAAPPASPPPTAPPSPAPTPPPTPTPVPPAPDAARYMDPLELRKREIWRAGRALMDRAGMPLKQQGTFLGKLAADFTFEVFAQAVESVTASMPGGEIQAYLMATCQSIAGVRQRRAARQTALEAGNDAAVDEWLNRKEASHAQG